MKINEYYANRDVQDRMIEFLGGRLLDKGPCVYITTCDDVSGAFFAQRPPTQLSYYLERGQDVSRSLWDRESLIAHLDLEYVNFDYPAEPYFDPLRVFAAQEPVAQAAVAILLACGIAPLHLLSGRGHHFVWRVRRDAPAFEELAKLGRISESLKKRYEKPPAFQDEPLNADLGAAFSGLSLIIEYVAHLIKEQAVPHSELPVELTAVAVGPGQRGREMVSIDISEYGDPLDSRVIRVPFSIYRKPWRKNNILNGHMIDEIPYMFLIPLYEMDVQQGMLKMRNADQTAELARRASVQIPDQSEAMEALIRAYRDSELAGFHNGFYSQEHDPPEDWPHTYDQTPVSELPRCIQYVLEWPNDLLLKPAGIRQVVVALLARKWHPRHIAGLIRSKYERDFCWGKKWYFYDAASRADFYVRVFSGLIAAGRDELVDFNCHSTKEKRFCFYPHAACNLEGVRASALGEMAI